MAPVKRKAHINAGMMNVLRMKTPNAKSKTKSEPMKAKTADDGKESGKSMSEEQPKSELPVAKNNSQQAGRKRGKSNSPLDSINATILKRRKMSIVADRVRLAKLLAEINKDPPPPWHTASLMWLDVDVLERRIESYEKEEETRKNAEKEKLQS